MADEHHGQTELLLQVGQQIEDLRTNRDVKSAGGLVGNDRVGLQGKSTGDCNALALTAGKLPGKRAQHGVGQTDHLDQLLHASLALLLRADLVNVHGVHKLVMNGHARVKRRRRVLEDNGDDAADGLALIGGTLGHVDALEVHVAGSRCLQAAHDVRRRGLAAAGFAHDADGLAGHELQREPVDGMHLVRMQDGTGTGLENNVDIVQEDDGGLLACRCFGFGHYCSPPYGFRPRRAISSSGSSAYQ